uniref:metallothionein n=2 Tax=Oculatella sp. LEGE 06141 TaxID=1828648 RepID=UPI0030DD6EB8
MIEPYAIEDLIMSTVTQMKCACDPCLCIVSTEDAVQKDGKYYCSETCAEGHPNGHGDCGHTGCTC